MRRQHPDHRMDIPVSLQVYHQLLGASAATDFAKEDWEIAAEAIDEWVRRHNPDALAAPAASGYQWKRLFLPDGTLLRTVFAGKNYHCLVEGDRILYEGKAVSPSCFVNAVGGMRRNAWLCTWILFPDTKEWKLADTLRARGRPRRAHKTAADHAPATQAATVRPAVNGAPVNDAPAPMDAPKASAPESPRCEHPMHDRRDRRERVPTTNPGGEDRRRHRCAGIPLSPPPCARGPDRRSNRDDEIAALLRQQLLPLLYEICAFDGMAAPTGTAPVA